MQTIDKIVKVKKGKDFKIADDGYARILIDTYYHAGNAFDLVESAMNKTGVTWKTFGCFMDNCCLAVDKENYEKLPDEFEFTYKWYGA